MNSEDERKATVAIMKGLCLTAIHRRYKYSMPELARIHYRLVRTASRLGDPMPGDPVDCTQNIRSSLEVAAAKLPDGWFRYRTAVWLNKDANVSMTIRAMRARFAACDFLTGSVKIEAAINAWQCKRYSSEVRWLCDESTWWNNRQPDELPGRAAAAVEMSAVLPRVERPYRDGIEAQYSEHELRWDPVYADSLSDDSDAKPRTLADLDGILANLPGPAPLLPLPEFRESEHVSLMLELLVEAHDEMQVAAGAPHFSAELLDSHRTKMKLLAAFVHRAL